MTATMQFYMKEAILQNPKKILFYIPNYSTSITVFNVYNTDVIFNGQSISISGISGCSRFCGEYDDQGRSTQNRYYFTDKLSNCDIGKMGINFFYIAGNKFLCTLSKSYTRSGQNNIVVIQGDFTDSQNIHSIIGSNGTNHIEVSYAGYVDGKGGSDVITAKNSNTIIKGYFGDYIHGRSLVLLPLNFSDIAKMTYADNIVTIYDENGEPISIDKQTLVKTADNLFITPTKVDDKTKKVINLQVTKTINNNIVLENELNDLRTINNPNFRIIKQLFSKNYHITIGDTGNHIFYPDKDYHNFYWEAPSDASHLYLFDKRSGDIIISKANGILDFRQLNSSIPLLPVINAEWEVKISKDNLHVTLLPGYKDITVTFDGEEYYQFQNGELKRNYCSHSLKIDGKFSINGNDLLNHHNCFIFDSKKVLFLKSNDDLWLLSGKGALSILNYYSHIHEHWGLSIKLNNNSIIEPEEFKERANNPSSFRYYRPNEQGLQIYHNQPINKNDIGLVDLKGQSILDFNMKVIDGNLLLLRGSNTIVKAENWNTYQPAREMMFTFSDVVISNAKCVISTCDPEDVIEEFQKEKSSMEKSRQRHIRDKHYRLSTNRLSLLRKERSINSDQPKMVASSISKKSSWINDSVAWVKESITNAYETTSGAINWLFNKDKTSQKMESAVRFEDIKTWNKENNESFNENVEEETPKNVVGFYDEMLGRLNKEDLKRGKDLCEEIKANFEPYKDSDIHTCLRNVAELIKDKCNIDNNYLNNLCANKLLESMKEQTDHVKRYNMQKQGEYIRNLYDQDGNIILLTYLLGWYSKIKSKDEKDVYDEIKKTAYEVLKVTKACEKISKAIDKQINILEDDIYNSSLGRMIIDINATKDEIVEVLFCSLENLSLIKLEEDRNKEESSKIEEFMEKYKVYVENVLGIVAEDIIDYNSKLSEKKSYEHKELCNKVEQQSRLKKIQPISDTNANVKRAVPKFFTEYNNRLQPAPVVPTSIKKSEKLSQLLTENSLKQLPLLNNNLSLIDTSGPASSFNNVSVHNNLTQVRGIS